MLKMAQAQYIKYLYENEDKSLREIARITEHSFQTVQKYAYKENWSADNRRISPERFSTREYIPIIDKWLEEDRREQRHSAARIHRLQEYGFTGGAAA